MVRWLDGQGVANVECTCKHCNHQDDDADGHGVIMIMMIMVIIAMILIHNLFYL